ncbi:LOW QUALITY PROTEIN: hypothetical protein Cgig2_013585 [Carnegiea gigantea]|uniref:Uncharacterized protein n=1 Tax=Carnegiea gigantea TaxID=171969 RepID=A0A9Q1KAT7_9CARY|nr:LOW QUALITY PROTEIN: hypothetical protein Cgig2_013585 [Carnegiea gigantea]
MNKDQEDHMGSGNGEHKMSDKPKIRHRKVKEFNNQMSYKGLRQLIENLNNNWHCAWLRNFDTCSCSLPLTYDRMRVTEHDVHMTLGFPKGSLELSLKNKSNVSIEFTSLLNRRKQQWLEHDSIPKCGSSRWGEDFRRNFVMLVVSTCLRGNQRGELCYLDCVVFKLRSVPCPFPTLRGSTNDETKSRVRQQFDTLDNMTVTNEEEEVHEKERRSKSDKDKAKAKDETGVSKVKSSAQGSSTPSLLGTSSRILVNLILRYEKYKQKLILAKEKL